MVYVLDKRKKPLMPCSLKRARQLLDRGRARVRKRYPFTIRRVDRFQEDSVLQPLTLKIDPGSKTTGMARVREAGPKAEPKAEVVSLIELRHRGEKINKKLKQSAAFRRRPRSANLRYRAPHFNNRRPKKGWLPPSIQHRVDSKLSRRKQAPVLVSFDCHRPGTCPLRRATDRDTGDLWRRVPTRNSCRRRSSGIPVREMETHMCLLRCGQCAPQSGSGDPSLEGRIGSSVQPRPGLHPVESEQRR